MRSPMSKIWLKSVEPYRILTGDYGSDSSAGNNGMFHIKVFGEVFRIMSSDGMGWDHVSVSSEGGVPLWADMHKIKRLFFEDDEVVMQLHPAESNYVNTCVNCLHLWRPQNETIPVPPVVMV